MLRPGVIIIMPFSQTNITMETSYYILSAYNEDFSYNDTYNIIFILLIQKEIHSLNKFIM